MPEIVKDNMVKVYTRCGDDLNLVNESEMRLFLAGIRIWSRGDRCLVDIGTKAGGAELDMPGSMKVPLAEAILSLCTEREQKKILQTMAERLN